MTTELISISPGNRKLRTIPSVSLPPRVTCPACPCHKECYAQKMTRYCPQAGPAWQRNLSIWRTNPEAYFGQIRQFLARKTPRFFRWHVAGDIPTPAYFQEIKQIAKDFPEIKFLIFTKRHELDFGGLPANLAVVLSMWPSWGTQRKRMPRAWMRDETNPDPRIPADALECSGNCETCGMCWNLKTIGRDVVFHKH